MALLEHVAFQARDLDRTGAFYELLGAETSRHAAGKRLFVTFEGSTRLIFDHTDSPPDVSAVTYLGIELASFGEVDEMFARLSEHVTVGRDMREEYRHVTGPYGFFVADPDGYVIKVFKYHEQETPL